MQYDKPDLNKGQSSGGYLIYYPFLLMVQHDGIIKTKTKAQQAAMPNVGKQGHKVT